MVGGGAPDDHSIVAVDDILSKVYQPNSGLHNQTRDRSFKRLWKNCSTQKFLFEVDGCDKTKFSLK